MIFHSYVMIHAYIWDPFVKIMMSIVFVNYAQTNIVTTDCFIKNLHNTKSATLFSFIRVFWGISTNRTCMYTYITAIHVVYWRRLGSLRFISAFSVQWLYYFLTQARWRVSYNFSYVSHFFTKGTPKQLMDAYVWAPHG